MRRVCNSIRGLARQLVAPSMTCAEYCRVYTGNAVELAVVGSVVGSLLRPVVLLIVAEIAR